ncbi:MAG: hypothetical protein NVS4B8_01340 [Herpetosiphon sp.]
MKVARNRWFVGFAVVAMALVMATSQGAAARTSAASTTVEMQNFKFAPDPITVQAGTTIVWNNTSPNPHTAKAVNGAFDSGNVDQGKSYSFTFSNAGTYKYYCLYHGSPTGTGMVGTIVVQAAAAAPAPTTAAPAPTTAAPAPSGVTPSISVMDQQIDGSKEVTVASVTAAQDGWIAFHKNGPDGKLLLTPLAGLIPIKAGTHTNVRAKLDEVPADGQLYAMLHIDAGIIGKYEFPGGPDVPVTVDGKVVVKPFHVTVAAAPATMPSTGANSTTMTWLLGLALVALVAGSFTTLARRRNMGR